MDKRDRAKVFRDRLSSRMRMRGVSKTRLARECGVDRSTFSQIINADEPRLPNAHLAAECADRLGVSVDWLLGLAERSETASDLLTASFRFTEADRTPADAQIIEWHREAAGYKIRHVPATLPDLLKIDAVLDFEYSSFLDRTPEQASIAMRDKIKWLREPGSDYEICVPIDLVEALARGEGYWRGLRREVRQEQIGHMAGFCRDHYPSLRLYLYDAKKVFSSPITIFGPLLAAIYVGRHYLVLRETRQVRALTDHFDNLVRDSETDARSAAATIEAMLHASD